MNFTLNDFADSQVTLIENIPLLRKYRSSNFSGFLVFSFLNLRLLLSSFLSSCFFLGSGLLGLFCILNHRGGVLLSSRSEFGWIPSISVEISVEFRLSGLFLC